MKNSKNYYSDGHKESITANLEGWERCTTEAAQDDQKFRRFRRADAMLKVVEGSPRVSGIWNLRRLMRNKNFIASLPLLQESESIGLPLNLIDFTVDGNMYSLNPTTLRYANNVCNLLDIFGAAVFDGSPIFEIGGGTAANVKYLMILQNNSQEI
jgi:hypothetical protein